MLQIDGTVESIIYENHENGYTVCDIASGGQLITLTGYMPNLTEGENVVVHGEWVTHVEYGDQFKVEYYERRLPNSEDEIEKYLASGLLPGVGKTTARRIVEKFGTESLSVIEHEPDRLLEISGLTRKKVDAIYKKFVELIGVREVVIFFQRFGVSPAAAVKAFKLFGTSTVNIITENPYLLSDRIDGITFKTADAIAQELGIDKNSYARISSGIRFLMKQIGYLNGHTFLPRSAVAAQASQYLEVEKEKAEEAVSEMLLKEELVLVNMGEYDALYLRLYYDAEKRVAERLLDMSQLVFDIDIDEIDELIEKVEAENGIQLAEAQLEAVRSVFQNAAMVITGGPGTGKTTIIKTIISLMQRSRRRVALTAPTGRAAKRMSELCGMEAKTIHRLLEITPGVDEVGSQFSRNAHNPLECDVLIVDEMSMVDILLMDSLLEAVPRGARIVMVGDSDQLPSVGAGNVLKDIIDSDALTCIRLTEIFRQAQESMIVVNAHRINHGEMPMFNDRDNDFFLVTREDPLQIPSTIADLCARRLPNAYGLRRISQIQVLTPTRKSLIGVQNLNAVLQDALNPPDGEKPEKVTARCVFRLGDKVMQIRNNYQLEWQRVDGKEKGLGVFNGDVGFITEIDNRNQKLTVAFDDRLVLYDFMLLDELELAYAVTVHKSQGSEFEAIVMPVFETHRLLMTRNLLYTAITRAKSLVVLVGQEQYIKKFVENDNIQYRFSGLKNKLQIF
ncbi:SF1B family DNA helicase RecD2 [Ructibacterium gallinarum]|uniref:ATP-dependent RecD2 DNA helicase n=1 Tax=Ructibacterium gallinarum TaxID=2779355 RepID=A0A9D5M0B0_9FIRM|nr:ATP-dependent RecD-like DNA helicase [Ructibacterium gallinarum]MBE5041236.1 ATP-dependent RecD-like DNA helicase [Ructibacterium gallinarum]